MMNEWSTSKWPAWPGWETVRIIGKGGFGTVYEIQQTSIGKPDFAAMKVISVPQSESEIEELLYDNYTGESISARFYAEAERVKQEYTTMREMRDCSNIVFCDDIQFKTRDYDGITCWDIMIKMELLTPLKKALGSDVQEKEIIQIGKDLCKALIACEKRAVYHRDIKPQNIFVKEDQKNAHKVYKLGDFGIAKPSNRSMSQSRAGTIEFMAPEVYNNQKYGHQADQYSLGLVLYWLLNEKRGPFLPLPPATPRASDEEESLYRRLEGERIPAPVHGSKELKKIVLKACEFDPANRYRNATEMLADLESIDSGSVPPPPPPPEGWTCKKCNSLNDNESSVCKKCGAHKDNNAWIWAVAAVALIAGIIILLSSLQPDPPTYTKHTVVSTPTPTAGISPQINTGDSSGQSTASGTITSPEPTLALTPTPNPTPALTPDPTPTTASFYIPSNPASLYGKALRENLVDGVYYSDAKKVGIVTDTYNDRKKVVNGEKKYASWYRGTHSDDMIPGYRVELYFADGLLFFAAVDTYDQNSGSYKTVVTLHYWGDQLVACRDKRGSDTDLCYAGSTVYEAVMYEFGSIYDLAPNYY